jgi:FkbM family methyltransferase
MRGLIKRSLRRLGYDIQSTQYRFVDAYEDQAKLLVGRAAVIFDVGAYVGQTIEIYRRLFPAATIWAFEPFEESFQTLTRKFGGDPLVKLQRLALADAEGTRSFRTYAGSATNSLLETVPNAGFLLGNEALVQARGTVPVQVTTLDLFCARHNISTIDALKIDVQGAELMVFGGAKDLLRRKAIGMIYAEVQFTDQYKDQVWFCELWKFFQANGYELYGLYDIWRGGGGYICFGNALFLPARTERGNADGALDSASGRA